MNELITNTLPLIVMGILFCLLILERRNAIKVKKYYLHYDTWNDIEKKYIDMNQIAQELEVVLKNTLNNDSTSMLEKEKECITRCQGIINDNYIQNPIISAMLMEKSDICKELGIHFKCKFILPKTHILSDMELVGLLGNLLDNAIEAANLADEQEKYVNLQTLLQKNIFCIKVENTKNIRYSPKASNFDTVKKCRNNHGYGMKVIKRILRAHKGIINTEDYGNLFIIRISIPWRQ